MSKYYIYCHTSPSGKNYVGWTGLSVEERWLKTVKEAQDLNRHRAFIEAIRKYGPDNFTHVLIEEFEDRAESLEAEQFWIQYLNTKSPNGYNITDGGEGNWGRSPSEETRKKISDALKGKPLSEETKRKIGKANRGTNCYMFGKPKSEEVCLKISKSLTGRRKSKPEIVEEVEEIKEEIIIPIEVPKKNPNRSGSNSYQYGIPRSEEVRKKNSASLKGVKKTKEHAENISKGLKSAKVSPELKEFRSARQIGELASSSKYSDELIEQIRKTREETGLSYMKLGKIFGISGGYIGDIIRGDHRSKPTPSKNQSTFVKTISPKEIK